MAPQPLDGAALRTSPIKSQDALLIPASAPPHRAMTHDRGVLELSCSPPLSERPGGKGRAGRREPARGSPLSLRAGGGGEGVGRVCACAPGRRQRVGAEGSRGNKAGPFAADQWEPCSPPSGLSGDPGLPERSAWEGCGGGGSPGREDGSGARTKWPRRLSRPSPTRARCFSLSPAGCGLQASRTPRCLRLRLRDIARVAGSGFRVQEVARPPRGLPAKWGAPIRSPRGGGLDVPALSQLPRVFVCDPQ